MSLVGGTRLGPYEIVEPLGAGGMGEVYKAKDTRVERMVALKVLPAEFFDDRESIARFEREARMLASLNHPGIAHLYSFEEIAGSPGSPARHLLIMELADGQTLAERLVKGPMALDQLLRTSVEIASALHAAHRAGIVHRDLKPGNVMLTKSGAKLLDFGLAKVAASPVQPAALTSRPTEAPKNLTERGTILGTVQYMSPEQLEGKEADPRSDIFAFGAVLYEMATGRKAFEGTSQASLIAAILSREPPSVSSIQPSTPPALDRLVKACLAKDPEDRWQSVGDVAKELKWIAEGSSLGSAAPRTDAVRRRGRERLAWALAAIAIVLALLLAFRGRGVRPAVDLTRFKILAPPSQNFMSFVVLSPDARRLLLLLRDDGGKNRLAIRSLDSLEVRILPGTDDARGAFWSPDSREVALFADGKLKRMSADGGPARAVCESGAAVWGAWSREGTILFEKEFGGPLFAVPAAGGTPGSLMLDSAEGDVHQNQPCFLPDGRHFIFLASNADLTRKRIVLGSLDSKETRPLFPSDTSAVYAEPGYLLFGRDDAVLAWRFDPKSLRLVGEPVPAFGDVHWMSSDSFLSLSSAGSRVAYVSWSGRRRLVWADRKGRELGSLGEVAAYTDVRISPDGRRVAVALRDPSHGRTGDIWVLDAARGTGIRITSEPTDDFNPAWFPNGDRVAYVSDRFGYYNLFERPAGGGPERLLVRSEQDKIFPTILPGGRQVLLNGVEVGGRYYRQIFSLDDPKSPVRLGSDSRLSEEHPTISPDGRWSAFDSIESEQREVFLQPVPDGSKRQVSLGGGQMPVWNRNGRELYYVARDGTLMSVALRPEGGRLEPGEPQPLFPLQFDLSGELPWHLQPYDVSPDGQRFLVIRRAPGVEPNGVVVVTNWSAMLRAR